MPYVFHNPSHRQQFKKYPVSILYFHPGSPCSLPAPEKREKGRLSNGRYLGKSLMVLALFVSHLGSIWGSFAPPGICKKTNETDRLDGIDGVDGVDGVDGGDGGDGVDGVITEIG